MPYVVRIYKYLAFNDNRKCKNNSLRNIFEKEFTAEYRNLRYTSHLQVGKECRHLSPRRVSVLLLTAVLLLSAAMASASLPKVNPDEVRSKLERLGRPEKIEIDMDKLSLNEQINYTGPKAMKPGSVIVRLDTGAKATAADAALEEALFKLGGSIDGKLEMKDRSEGAKAAAAAPLRFAFLKFAEDADVEALAAELGKVPGVVYAEPNYMLYPDATTPPTDTYFANGWQYYLYNDGRPYIYITSYAGTPGSDIKAMPAWEFANSDFGLDSSSVVIGVIDQGVCFWIPELTPNMWINEAEFFGTEGVDDDGNGYMDDVYGYDFYHNLGINDYDSGYFPWMEDPHGTHVAGTISSDWDGYGVAGASRNAKIMSLKFLGPEGGYTEDAMRALEYAAMMGADLTSNSWGGGEPSMALADAIKAAGILFVTSAGNDGNNNDFFGHYPSSYANPDSPMYCENVISVTATDANDNLSAYSCYGEKSVNIAAPGTWILAPIPMVGSGGTLDYAYSWYTGTSMATPQVSAVAAMLIAQDRAHTGYSLPQYDDPDPYGDWDTVKEIILNSAERKAQLNGLVSTGGRLNMYNALTWQRLPSVASISATPTFSSVAPVDIEVSVNIEDAAYAAEIGAIEHRWFLTTYDAWWQPQETGITATGQTATLTVPEGGYGNYQVRYEMYDTDNDVVVTTSYKHVLVAEPESVLLVLDDQWYGYEDMSWLDEIPFIAFSIPYHYAFPPMDIPSTVPNIVFWTTSYTTSGVINEDDARWIIDYLKYGGGKLFLASYEMLNMLDGYYGESAMSTATAAELLETLKIDGYVTDHTYKMTGDLQLYEPMLNVEGDTIAWANELTLDLEYEVWYPSILDFGDVVTDFGPGAYPILLSIYGGAIDDPTRAAYGLSYAGDDYRLVLLTAPLEAMQGQDYYDWWFEETESNGDMYNFWYFMGYSWLFLNGEGPDRLVAWLDNPKTGGTYSAIDFAWGIQDVPETSHGASIWYRINESSPWEPVTMYTPADGLEYPWMSPPTTAGSQYQVMLQVYDEWEPYRVAYDFEGPLAFWPISSAEGARAGVDRENGLVNFYINANKPGMLYVYDLSGTQIFSREVEQGISTVVWDMMYKGMRVARGLYAFRIIYEDGSASRVGRVLINF